MFEYASQMLFIKRLPRVIYNGLSGQYSRDSGKIHQYKLSLIFFVVAKNKHFEFETLLPKQTNNNYRIYNSHIIGKRGPQNIKNVNRVWLPAYTALVDTNDYYELLYNDIWHVCKDSKYKRNVIHVDIYIYKFTLNTYVILSIFLYEQFFSTLSKRN